MTFLYNFLLRPLRLIRSLPNPSVGLSSKLAVMACLILLLQIKHRGALNSKQFTHLSAVSKQSVIMEQRHKFHFCDFIGIKRTTNKSSQKSWNLRFSLDGAI